MSADCANRFFPGGPHSFSSQVHSIPEDYWEKAGPLLGGELQRARSGSNKRSLGYFIHNRKAGNSRPNGEYALKWIVWHFAEAGSDPR